VLNMVMGIHKVPVLSQELIDIIMDYIHNDLLKRAIAGAWHTRVLFAHQSCA